MPPSHHPLRGALYSFAAFSLYGFSDITIKFLGSSYSAAQIVFFAGMASFPLILLQMIADKDIRSLRPVYPGWTALRVAIIIVNGLLVTYTFGALPLSQAYAIFFLMPLFVCLLASVFLGEKIDLPRGLAVLVGLIGVAVVLRPGYLPLQLAHFTALCGASFGALYYVILRKTGAAERTAVIILYPVLGQTASAALLMPWFYNPMPASHLGLIGVMAISGFLGSLLIVAAYRNAPAIVVAPMQYGQIIWATLFGVLYFNEPMDLATVIGIAIIIAAGLFIMARSKPPRAENPKSIL